MGRIFDEKIRIAFVFSFLNLAFPVFALKNEAPSVLMELNTGYAFGVELPDAIPIELKLVYPFTRFGLTLESGVLLSDNLQSLHIF
ncbi:MAG: hypothetical protein LBD58_04455 [Treponema sp.]|jgi:hypothetical protein|nr:hypothetical protein [Treponema sp.]